jgi:ATP-binding cassette subfamily B protein
MGIRFSQETYAFLLGLLSMVGTASIWAYAVIKAVGGHITVGDVALAFQAAERGRSGLDSLFRNLGQFYEHTIFAGTLFRFLDFNPSSIQGALAPPPESPRTIPKNLKEGIEFRNVSFHYPRSERFVLRNLSFTIKADESVAIVGENGAGKTTLVKLLARFYDPTEGAIYLDGHDLREYDLEDLRRQIGVIFQDFVRYDLSVQENIGFGQVEFIDDQEKITRAAEKGGSLDIIRRLPQGFNTILGRTFEEGVDLSGGEWQKIALSRAFVRDAQILILDEPTAALDALAEYDIFVRFADLTADKTTVFISHRFSTVRMAQHIVVLQQGELTEEGTHDQLIAHNGRYAEMFNAQAERYK